MRRGNLLWISSKSVRLPRQCAFNQGMIAPGNHNYWKIRCALQHWLAMTRKNETTRQTENLYARTIPGKNNRGSDASAAGGR